jgi:ABC-type glycerol-3-phosphate transport system substrate-binding protein
LVGGDKDGYLGGWLFSLIGSQQLNSPMDLVQATVGNASFTDAKYTGWYTALDTLVKDGYWNDDVLSRNLDQGVTLFGQGGGAMSFESDGMLATSIKVLGGDKVGLMLPPTWGTGKMADYGYATQSCGYAVTSWSKHQQQAADFLAYLHTPDRLTAWYEATGVTPADDRFDTSLVTVPQLQTATKFDTTGSQAFLEEWLPVEIDGNADLPAGEMIFGGSGTPSDAAQLWERSAQEWRTAHPDELAGWQKMAGTQ